MDYIPKWNIGALDIDVNMVYNVRGGDTMRVQVNLNDDLVKRIDEYAAAIGLSRSAVCAMWIGQAALSTDTAIQSLERMGVDVAAALMENKTAKEKSGGRHGD